MITVPAVLIELPHTRVQHELGRKFGIEWSSPQCKGVISSLICVNQSGEEMVIGLCLPVTTFALSVTRAPATPHIGRKWGFDK